MVFWARKKKVQRPPFHPDRPLLWLSPHGCLTQRHAAGHFGIFARTGGGKSSAAVGTLRRAMLAEGWGLLELILKNDGFAELKRDCEVTGRMGDMGKTRQGMGLKDPAQTKAATAPEPAAPAVEPPANDQQAEAGKSVAQQIEERRQSMEPSQEKGVQADAAKGVEAPTAEAGVEKEKDEPELEV
jgi:hypothetical protein